MPRIDQFPLRAPLNIPLTYSIVFESALVSERGTTFLGAVLNVSCHAGRIRFGGSGGVTIFLDLDDGVGDAGLGGSGIPLLPLALLLEEARVRDARLTNDVVRVGEEDNEPDVERVSCSGPGEVAGPAGPFISIPGVTAPDF